MEQKFNVLTPVLMTVLIISCVWTVADVAYDVRMWESDVNGWMDRLKAMVLVSFETLMAYFVFRSIAEHALERNLSNNWYSQLPEYVLVITFILVTLNMTLYFIIFYINDSHYRWGEALMLNATALPGFLLYYVSIRNGLLFKKYSEKNVQLERVKVDQLETELKLLKAQYHPHFLFNALNTVYFQIDDKNNEALDTIDLLANLLRYQLYEVNRQVTVRQEMEYLEHYMRFQQLRTTTRLQFHCYIDPALDTQKIHPLLFQPLLENAFKYISGDYCMKVEILFDTGKIHFRAMNSIATPAVLMKKTNGTGLENLKRRLDLLYSGKHQFETEIKESTYTVNLIIELAN
ncbi:sensor histidine kinase [Pedobacter nyackensis]|uniref:sensor histidine kinase n=1 Tax=Pedobacter nyackensis TaxID=475255 RepID=UPI00292E3673|nr:histidine kinase [Pedobacter nyackensis]